MRRIAKVGLLLLSGDRRQILVCEKGEDDVTTQYIMPGGQFMEDTVEECLKNEIREELDCDVDTSTIEFVGRYSDVAAGMVDAIVEIDLYSASINGQPRPSTEIRQLHWIGAEDIDNMRVSPIVRNGILPDLVARGILLTNK